MATDSFLSKASDYAFARLKGVGGGPLKLPISLQTTTIICAAQGIIDNGGFQYFFESDFSNNPPYSVFSDAYRRIGADEAAECIDRAVRMFPFPDPHLSPNLRQKFIEAQAMDGSSEFFSLGDRVCGDKSVWEKLALYVTNHSDDFEEV